MINNNPIWTDIKVTGEWTKQEYFGRFLIKPFLTHAERADAVRLAERLSRGIEKSEAQKMFLSTLAFLKFHIQETDAKWWLEDGLSLIDEAPVYELADTLAKIQNPKEEEKEENSDKKEALNDSE